MVESPQETQVEFKDELYAKLTPAQKEVLSLILDELLTPRAISKRRHTSLTATYKIIKILKGVGFIKGRFDRVVEKANPPIISPQLNHPTQRTLISYGKQIRLHGQEFHADLIWTSDLYHKKRKDTPSVSINGNTIRLFSHSIEIYCDRTKSFYDITPQACLSQSESYWEHSFREIEEKLGIIIMKGQRRPKQVNWHFAEVFNELAEQSKREGKEIRVRGDDLKSWLIADFSNNQPELECIHPKTALSDMGECIQPFFNDMRSYTQQTGEAILLSDIIRGMSKMSANQAVFDANMASHISAVQKLGTAVDELVKTIKELKKG